MTRLIFLAVLVLFQNTAFAAVYKCALPDGKVAYQASPCPDTHSIGQGVLPAPSPAAAQSAAPGSAKKKCVGKEMSIDFTSMPLSTTLNVIADASGNKLSFSPRVDVSGAFHYVCVPWDTILGDIAVKYNLSTRVDGGTIYVHPK